MLSTIKQHVATGKRLPNRPENGDQESRLNIVVIFTSVDATVAAVKTAGTLAENLNARITLLAPLVVTYPLPLTSPPIPLNLQDKRFQEIARESPVDIRVRLYLCRDPLQTLRTVLVPHSLVIVGGHKHWWPVREKNLARKLR